MFSGNDLRGLDTALTGMVVLSLVGIVAIGAAVVYGAIWAWNHLSIVVN